MVKHIPPAADEEKLAAEDAEIVQEAPEAAATDDVVREEDTPEKGIPERAHRQSDGSYILPLQFPVTLNVQRAGQPVRKREYAELRLYRMTGKDLIAVSSSSSETALATAFSRSSRLNPAVATALFQKLDSADAADASAIVGFFFGAGGRTGR